MQQEIIEPLIELGASLTSYAVKGTVSAVQTKVKTLKTEKNAEAIRNSYDEIISELLEEREDIIRIAQQYRYELEKIEISDDDIEHLHKTVEQVLDLLKPFMGLDSESVESFKMLKDIINVDTLKTMQLLGFNYKEAIGVPLTNLCSKAISNLGNKNKPNNKRK
jgi:archaellum component FlaC